MCQTIRSILALSFFCISASAFALPLAEVPYLENEKAQAASSEENFGKYTFNGIVALSNCSGSLVRFQNSLPEEKAMVLTNGHCLANMMGRGMPSPGKVIVNKAVKRTMHLLRPDTGEKLAPIQTTKIIYATMTKTDMTLYELKQTFGEIEAQFRIKPLTLSDRYPSVGEGIDIISGYWKRGYSCAVESIVHELREAGWTMVDSIRYSRPGCETIGGTSGSPIISRDTKEVVGVNNTGNEDGEKCTMNNPCEVDARGTVTYEKGLSYGQQTSWIYGCLTADRKLDLSLADCKLAKPSPTDTRSDTPSSSWPSSSLL